MHNEEIILTGKDCPELPKVVIFNGPPGSGKDHIVDKILDARATQHSVANKGLQAQLQISPLLDHPNVHKREMKTALYRLVRNFYLLTDEEMEWLKANKETSSSLLHGRSLRQAMIHVSEVVIKPVFGIYAFGTLTVQDMAHDTIYLYSDCGFVEELISIVNAVGFDNILVFRLARQGHDFSNDSRRYFTDEELKYIPFFDLVNIGTPTVVQDAITYIDQWLLGNIKKA